MKPNERLPIVLPLQLSCGLDQAQALELNVLSMLPSALGQAGGESSLIQMQSGLRIATDWVRP